MKTRFNLFIALLILCFGGSLAAFAQPVDDAPQVSIRPDRRLQTVQGWGVSLCWWAHMCGRWDEARVDSLVRWLVSPDGLNYNVFRYNIGGGDDPLNRHCKPHHMAAENGGKGIRAEMQGFRSDSLAAYDWTADAGQRAIMLKIKQLRPDAVFEAFSNTPPWWMTHSGCAAGHEDAGRDNLRPECYEAFAHYLVDVCKHYRDKYGIEFRTLEPFNEPLTAYWGRGGSQEGCHFDARSQVNFLKVLRPILDRSGLRTMLAASDETSVSDALRAFDTYARDGEALRLIGQWNVHTYSATNAERDSLRRLCKQHGLPLWMSESGNGGWGIRGNLNMAKRLFDDMRHLQPAVWCDWQYVEEHTDQWNLVEGVFSAQRFHKVKNYDVRSQVTRFIRQGYTLLDVPEEHTLAALSPSADTLVVVQLNPTARRMSCAYDLSGFGPTVAPLVSYTTSAALSVQAAAVPPLQGRTLVSTLPARSIRTYIIKVDGKAF